MLLLKQRARASRARSPCSSWTDNFAINVKRTKSLLRDIIAAGAADLLGGTDQRQPAARTRTCWNLIAESGGKWIFIGMESLDPANLASVNKSFNKALRNRRRCSRSWPGRNVYAITSFIFGLDKRHDGSRRTTLAAMREWPPVLPVFGQITPFPADAALTDRLAREGRLTRPKHWLEFAPFRMGHAPLKISLPGVQDEVKLRVDQLL